VRFCTALREQTTGPSSFARVDALARHVACCQSDSGDHNLRHSAMAGPPELFSFLASAVIEVLQRSVSFRKFRPRRGSSIEAQWAHVMSEWPGTSQMRTRLVLFRECWSSAEGVRCLLRHMCTSMESCGCSEMWGSKDLRCRAFRRYLAHDSQSMPATSQLLPKPIAFETPATGKHQAPFS
jgi:hypothetical protein